MRLMMDGRLMDINPDRFQNKILKDAVSRYNSINDVLQEKLVKDLANSFASGNFGPKPDFKKPFINVGVVMINSVGRITVGQAAALVLGTAVAVAIGQLGLQGDSSAIVTQAASAVPEVAANYIGAKPSSGTQLKPEAF